MQVRQETSYRVVLSSVLREELEKAPPAWTKHEAVLSVHHRVLFHWTVLQLREEL